MSSPFIFPSPSYNKQKPGRPVGAKDAKPRKRDCKKGSMPAASAIACNAMGKAAGNKRKDGSRCCGPDLKRKKDLARAALLKDIRDMKTKLAKKQAQLREQQALSVPAGFQVVGKRKPKAKKQFSPK